MMSTLGAFWALFHHLPVIWRFSLYDSIARLAFDHVRMKFACAHSAPWSQHRGLVTRDSWQEAFSMIGAFFVRLCPLYMRLCWLCDSEQHLPTGELWQSIDIPSLPGSLQLDDNIDHLCQTGLIDLVNLATKQDCVLTILEPHHLKVCLFLGRSGRHKLPSHPQPWRSVTLLGVLCSARLILYDIIYRLVYSGP